jgi:ABC-type glycerol-3-phosphate transport system substrate-binding protein
MKKNLMKNMGIVLVLAMILAVAACTNSNNTSTSNKTTGEDVKKSDEAPVIEYMNYFETGTSMKTPIEETIIAKKWQEDVGFKLKVLNTPIDTYETKLNVILSSGDLPDIIGLNTLTGSDIMNEYGPKGLFVNLYDHMDKLPNMKKLMDQFPDWPKIMQAEDGNMYGFPEDVVNFSNIMYTSALIRNDLLQKVNIDIKDIKTIEDLTNALRALKGELNGGAPWIQRNGYNEFMVRAGYLFGTNFREYWDEDMNAMVHPAKAENFKALVTWLSQLYKEGLIHTDWATMSDETWERMLSANQGAFSIDRMSLIGDLTFDQTFDFQPILYPEVDGKRYKQPAQATIKALYPYVINAKSKNLDKALEAMDYMFEKENAYMFQNGIEGKTFVKDDGPDSTIGGVKWLVKLYGMNGDNKDAEVYYEHGFQQFGIVSTEDNIKNFMPRVYPETFFKFSEVVKANGGFAHDKPVLKFSAEETQIKKQYETQINTYFDENIIKFVSGKRPIGEWDKFVKEIDGMGLDQVQKAYDDSLVRWNNIK